MLKGSQYLCTARSLFSQFSGELVIAMHTKRANTYSFSVQEICSSMYISKKQQQKKT